MAFARDRWFRTMAGDEPRKEALGLQLQEHLWDFILDAPLPPSLSVAGAFRALARRMREFPAQFPAVPCPADYFGRVGAAMELWVSLFEPA